MTDPDPDDDRAAARLGDPIVALMLLTRIPVPASPSPMRGARAAWAWPLAGALVAVLGWAPGAVGLALGLPAAAAAGLTLGAMILLTGGLHEDGLADCADGFWGGADPDRRLKIMKDSRIGSYGVLALILVTGLRWSLFAALFAAGPEAALAGALAAAILARAAMAGVMAALPFARPDGVGRLVGRPPTATAGAAVVLAAALTVGVAGGGGAAAVLSVAAAATGVAALARRKIGGQTGDVMGATAQLCEVAALVALVAAAA